MKRFFPLRRIPDVKMLFTRPLLLALFVLLGSQGYGQEQENSDRLATQGAADGTAAPTKTVEPFSHERRAALWTEAWGGMRVDWTAVADWPTGDSPAAKAARAWIGESLRYGRKSFVGDLGDWDAMTRFYGKLFLAENGQKQIEAEWRGPNGEETKPRTGMPDVDPGADTFLEKSPLWFSRHSAIVEYEDERIVSYRSGFYGSHVGNATSAAFVRCATFRKSDGKILGWDAFADTNAVFQLIREQAQKKFGKNADIYGKGIPVPDNPLFVKDGFWVFWGDYAIDTPHAYEEGGKFPSLFIHWHSADGCGDASRGDLTPGDREAPVNLLTHEAKVDFGIVKPLPDDWPGCFCREFWLPNNGPHVAVYYRVSKDGGKQLLARQYGDGLEDTILFDVDNDGVPELICQNHSQMGWHPWVAIYRLSRNGAEVCEDEALLEALQANFRFKLSEIPCAGNLTLELDQKTKSLSGGEGVKWIVMGPEVEADGKEVRVERIFLERLRDIKIPFKHVEPAAFHEVCRPEDL